MSNKHRAEYVEYPLDRHWRISVIDEPNDIVFRVDFFGPREKPGKWHHIAWIDQSGHDNYHVHLPPDTDDRIPLAEGLGREEKLRIGFAALRKYATEGRILVEGYVLQPSPLWNEIQMQILNRQVEPGTTRNARSISGVARIVSPPE